MVVKVCGMSDIGKRRELNEDSFKVCGFQDGESLGVCVLADGMGGHNAGEVASGSAVEIIAERLEQTLAEEDSEVIRQNIAEAIDAANNDVYVQSISNREHAGMGTTLVVVYVKDSKVWIANIGDSRAYVISPEEICRLTVDHSVVEELVQHGTITREEARNHPDKNIITRALGTEKNVSADFYDYTTADGETLILCSDGLTETVRDERIKEIISQTDDVENAVKTLVDEANANGGVDNITVVALRFEKEENK